jgi:ADP-heptose:LPS heptosyltransferase
MTWLYRLLSSWFPQHRAPAAPQRILFVLPCCIGDVVLATAALKALRRAYPQAQITWAVGTWSRGVVESHPLLDAVLDTGDAALPVKSLGGFWRFVRQVRAGRYDVAVSLVRSPLMGAALWLAGVPHRAGLDSDGRGFAYTVRAPIDPRQPRHEAEVYLEVVRALGVETDGCRANVAFGERGGIFDAEAQRRREKTVIQSPYIVVHPGGGRNPGMVMDIKRYPPAQTGELAARLAARWDARVVVIGAHSDQPLVQQVIQVVGTERAEAHVGLSFAQIAALAQGAKVYIGNDTGMTHLAAAAGARTVMILGPSDPARYAPYADQAITVWKPAAVAREGVAAGVPHDWDWARDGVSVDEVERAVIAFVEG